MTGFEFKMFSFSCSARVCARASFLQASYFCFKAASIAAHFHRRKRKLKLLVERITVSVGKI
jgi:hypothetical protein